MGTMNILIMLDTDYKLKLAPGETRGLQSVEGIVELLRKAEKIEELIFAGVQYFLPETIQSNEDLVALNPSWSANDIFRKDGYPLAASFARVNRGRSAGGSQSISEELRIDCSSIDALLFCT